jgi:hypothetical protein
VTRSFQTQSGALRNAMGGDWKSFNTAAADGPLSDRAPQALNVEARRIAATARKKAGIRDFFMDNLLIPEARGDSWAQRIRINPKNQPGVRS